jgi:hypothetical protein
MVGSTLGMLHLNYTELLLNTVVIFNMTSPPSDQASRAIAKEKAGKSPKRWNLDRSNKLQEVQTPGQALDVINGITAIEGLVAPLAQDEIVLVGFDGHLKRESELRFSDVSPAVQAQLWTAMHRMLRTRAEYEAQFLKLVPEGSTVRREELHIRLGDHNEILYRIAVSSGSRAEEYHARHERVS